MTSVNSGDQEELLVFGYSCKLFRDDERALLIDRGGHLIPWMGDDKLRIDRYDGRGALHDLSQHEPQPEGFHTWSGLTDRERKLEQLLNEERYLALYRDEDEERMLKEEEWKRLNVTGYNQANFNYESERGQQEEVCEESQAPAEPVLPEDQPYVPPDTLVLPPDMQLPETRRHADVIERTADFVARKGPQMEILIKAKQSDNSMFKFLSYDDKLQPFFRHLVLMIKAGRFTVGKGDETAEKANQESTVSDTKNFNRSDMVNDRSDAMYQPDTNCTYQLLIRNIRSRQQRLTDPLPPVPALVPATADAEMPGGSPVTAPASPSRPSPSSSPPSVAHSSPSPPSSVPPETSEAAARLEPGPASAPALIPAAAAAVQTPPAERRLIIDKMASYVAKNGRDFEVIVLSRGDERFNFLRESHEYHGYYRQKLALYEAELDKSETTASISALTAPVSFSIRGRRQEEPHALEPSALPVEESSGEEEERVEDADPAASENSSANAAEMINKWVAKAGPSRSIVTRGAGARTSSSSTRTSARTASSCTRTSSPPVASSTSTDRLRQERRRRAAQFMARMRSAIKDRSTEPPDGRDDDRTEEAVSKPVFGPVFDPSFSDDVSSGPIEEFSDRAGLDPHEAMKSASEDGEDDTGQLNKYKLVESSDEDQTWPKTGDADRDTPPDPAEEASLRQESDLENPPSIVPGAEWGSRSCSEARVVSDPEEGQCSSSSCSPGRRSAVEPLSTAPNPGVIPGIPDSDASEDAARVVLSPVRDSSPIRTDSPFGRRRSRSLLTDNKERSHRSHKKKSKKSHKHRHNGSSLLSSSAERHSRRRHSKKSKKSKHKARRGHRRDSSEEPPLSPPHRGSKRRRSSSASVTAVPTVVSLSPTVDEVIDLTSPVLVQSDDDMSPRSGSADVLPAAARSPSEPEPLISCLPLASGTSLVPRPAEPITSSVSLTSRLTGSARAAPLPASRQTGPAENGVGVIGVSASSEVVARMSQNLKSRLDMLMKSSALSRK